MKKADINVKFVKLSSEYARTNVTIDSTDDYIHQSNNNQLPYYLQELYRTSSMHSAIVNRKVNMLYGNGVNDKKLSQNSLNFLKTINPFESYDTILKKCAYDLEMYGGYFLRTIFDKAENKIVEVYHMPFERMRLGLPNKYNNIDKFYYWSDLTENITSYADVNEFEMIPAFNLSKNKKDQIIFIKDYTPSNEYYPSAIYEAGLLDIQTYAEISNFNNSTLHNGFAPSYLIFFRGSGPSEEQQDEIVKTIKKKYVGSENNGKPMIFFLDEEQEEPKIEVFENSELANQFESLVKQLKENILISHQFPKQLSGIQESGSLGNSKELLNASQIFRTDYIIPRQNILIKGFNMIMLNNGLEELEITNPNPNLITLEMNDLLNIMGVNEIRKLYGLEEVVKEEVKQSWFKKILKKNE